MPDVEGAPRLPRWYPVALALLVLAFFALGLRRADRTTLRGDEIVSLTNNAHALSIRQMVFEGVPGQVSSAPLLYLADKAVHEMRASVGYFGLTPPGYYRLPSLLFVSALGFAAALMLGLHLRGGTPAQFVLVLAGLAAFLFHPKMFAFAGTERPHALWNALWFLLLAVLLTRPGKPWAPMAILGVMAATATATCFQILAVGIALLLVRKTEGRPLTAILKEGVFLLAVPAAIGVFYAIQADKGKVEDLEAGEVAPHFFRFWLWSNVHVWIACAAMIALLARRPKLRPFALPPVALTALIVLVPLIFALTYSRGFSLVSRQYLWTTTALPLAILFAAVGWKELEGKPGFGRLAVLAAVCFAGGNLVVALAKPPRNDSRELAFLKRGGPVMSELPVSRPQFAYPRSMGEIEMTNLQLIAGWLRIRYEDVPVSDRVYLIKDVHGRLEAELLPADVRQDEAWRNLHVWMNP